MRFIVLVLALGCASQPGVHVAFGEPKLPSPQERAKLWFEEARESFSRAYSGAWHERGGKAIDLCALNAEVNVEIRWRFTEDGHVTGVHLAGGRLPREYRDILVKAAESLDVMATRPPRVLAGREIRVRFKQLPSTIECTTVVSDEEPP